MTWNVIRVKDSNPVIVGTRTFICSGWRTTAVDWRTTQRLNNWMVMSVCLHACPSCENIFLMVRNHDSRDGDNDDGSVASNIDDDEDENIAPCGFIRNRWLHRTFDWNVDTRCKLYIPTSWFSWTFVDG